MFRVTPMLNKHDESPPFAFSTYLCVPVGSHCRKPSQVHINIRYVISKCDSLSILLERKFTLPLITEGNDSTIFDFNLAPALHPRYLLLLRWF